MVHIDSVTKTITMTRGDTVKTVIGLGYEDGSEYSPVPTDVITFTVKENYKTDVELIKIRVPYNTMLLHIKPEDTKQLKMPHIYVYDMQIVHENGDVDTFIDKALLKITEEVG